ncbi:MAG: hypothetical protein R3D58_16220 [Saprospiraceae bacterium]|nr:hypothetical protein [Lewinellaceae bacterium]
MRYVFCLLLLAISWGLFAQMPDSAPGTTDLPPIRFQLDATMGANTARVFQEGDRLFFTVVETVRVSHDLVIPAGAKIDAFICAADVPTAPGRQMVWFELTGIQTPDQQWIPVDSNPRMFSRNPNRVWTARLRANVLPESATDSAVMLNVSGLQK